MRKYITHEMTYSVSTTGGLEIEHYPEDFDNDRYLTLYNTHSHTFYEILWFPEAGGMHNIDFVDYPIEKNTFFFISPGQLHHYYKNSGRNLIIKFVPEFLNDESVSSDIFLRYSIFNAFEGKPKLVIEDIDVMRSIYNIMAALERELPRVEQFGHLRFMQSLVSLLLIAFERIQTTGMDSKGQPLHDSNILHLNLGNPTHALFMRFRQAVEKDFTNIHTVAGYAEKIGVNSKYLANVVHECSSHTPLQLINDRILLEAKRLLRYSDKKIKDIANDLGYEDPSYFVKFFKRQTGMLPTEFRG